MLLLFTSNCLLINVHRGFSSSIFKNSHLNHFRFSLLLIYFERGGEESGLEGLLKEIGFKRLGEKIASNEGEEEEEYKSKEYKLKGYKFGECK